MIDFRHEDFPSLFLGKAIVGLKKGEKKWPKKLGQKLLR